MAKRIASVLLRFDHDPSYAHPMLLRRCAIYKLTVFPFCSLELLSTVLDPCFVYLQTKFSIDWLQYKAFCPSHTTAEAACVVLQPDAPLPDHSAACTLQQPTADGITPQVDRIIG